MTTQPPRLLKLYGAKCPRCGTHPRIRVTEEESQLHQDAEPDQLSLTYQCHHRLENGRTCDKFYQVPVRAFQKAA